MAYAMEPRCVDPLVVGRVIGDVMDMFIPTINMSVYYGTKHVSNGCDIKPSLATSPPTVHLSGFSDQLYTLVMTDPDAPSPSEPTKKEWIHWMVVNIPGAGQVTRGKTVLAYMGPTPPVGIHRFVLVLFRQKNPISVDNPPEIRANFNTRSFSNQFDLGLPVACVYFNAQKEPMNKRR
ncbi:Mother of ft and tfl1 [Thalictrum thalictroides]|uniref:Mother of ft and tfl1 n=1 Tax=Thalictrum thalictroides TaxID=46969 RepID=A0A7J6X886_THATH|nr:Mother of ft and tfl1 [Thalictrum thalictroides]